MVIGPGPGSKLEPLSPLFQSRWEEDPILDYLPTKITGE